jgi:hypothetical protein
MCGRPSLLRMLVAASVMCALTAPASAAGMGGMSMGGMAVGMTAGSALSGVAMGAAGAARANGASVPEYGDHQPIGASDGPSGLSASTGHNPFGNSQASSAWASLPATDPNLPVVVAPRASESGQIRAIRSRRECQDSGHGRRRESFVGADFRLAGRFRRFAAELLVFGDFERSHTIVFFGLRPCKHRVGEPSLRERVAASGPTGA